MSTPKRARVEVITSERVYSTNKERHLKTSRDKTTRKVTNYYKHS